MFMRIIPATMATQHPDNSSAPYWEKDGDGFVSVGEEILECLSSFRDLNVGEYMWDFEGKYADEAVIDKLFSHYHDYFKKNQLGRDKFLTFRLPNIWHEKGYSLLRALMVILTSEDFAQDLGLNCPPLFEVILPLTERAEQMMHLKESFFKLARFKSQNFPNGGGEHNDCLEIIPLVESVESQIGINKLLVDYYNLNQKKFRKKLVYLRPFLARSDPALSSGLLATVVANKVALSAMQKFSLAKKVAIYPIIGAGSLIFRGGLSPTRVKQFIDEYRGIRTVTVQSAFRYDYQTGEVKQAVDYLNRELKNSEAEVIKPKEERLLKKAAGKLENVYQGTIKKMDGLMEQFFQAVPRRRERRLHIGFLSYERKMGKHKLPRAINFTAGFYSLGVPPEFIGLGRGLTRLSKDERKAVNKHYHNMRAELGEAGRYLNKENLRQLGKKNSQFALINKDIELTEKILGVSFGPKTIEDNLHKNLTANILILKNHPEDLKRLIVETGKIRKSLG